MDRTFDAIVIGTGVSADSAAYWLRAAGWSVAVIDYRPFGGTCALRGCDPKKVLVGAAQLADWNRRMAGRGITFRDMSLDWPALMRFKRGFTAPVPKRKEEKYRASGIEPFHGRARFTGPATVEVNGESLTGRFVLIACGSRPKPMGIPGEELLTTSDRFLELDRLPSDILFLGGGYISFELAHLAARAGAAARILHRNSHPLAEFDPDLVGRLVEGGRRSGVDVQLDTPVQALERRGDRIAARTAAGESVGDMVVHGAGRAAEIDELELDRAGIRRTPRGIEVNEYLQSASNPQVYACGDAADAPWPRLTPVGILEGTTAARNLLDGNRHVVDYRGLASVVFTIPPLSRTGLSEREARERGLSFQVRQADTSRWFTTRRVNADTAGYKVLIEAESRRILGAHLLGPEADEVINLFALAIRFGIPADELARVPFTYPTGSWDVTYMVS
jgi:glutathione reductase (NADPH)